MDPLMMGMLEKEQQQEEKIDPHIAKAANEHFNKKVNEKTKKKEEDDATQGNALLNRIRKYYLAFPYLKEGAPSKPFSKWTTADMHLELQRIELEQNSALCYDSIKALHTMVMCAVEIVGIQSGVDLRGLTEFSQTEQAMSIVQRDLMRLSIKYDYYLSTGPEMSYLMGVVKLPRQYKK
jgi:hypothetical protein